MRAIIALLLLGLLAGCSSPPADPGYPDLRNSPIRGLTPQEISELENGSGAGLALPAELNGYPGPKHILEFADQLGLNETQRQQVQALFDAMKAEAQGGGRRVLDAYAALDRWFREGANDSDQLDALLEEVAEAEAGLRGVHLRAHLAAMPLLTMHQRAMYQELRGYGSAHDGHQEH